MNEAPPIGAVWIELPAPIGPPPWECPLCRAAANPLRGDPGSYIGYACDGGYMNKAGRPGRLARDIVQRRWPRVNPRADNPGNWTPYRACQQPHGAIVALTVRKQATLWAAGPRPPGLSEADASMVVELLAPAASAAIALLGGSRFEGTWFAAVPPIGCGLPLIEEEGNAPTHCPVCTAEVWMETDGVEVSPRIVRYRCDGEYVRLLRRDEATAYGYRVDWRSNAPCCRAPKWTLLAGAASSELLTTDARDGIAVASDILAHAGV